MFNSEAQALSTNNFLDKPLKAKTLPKTITGIAKCEYERKTLFLNLL